MTREYHEGYQQGYKDAKEEGKEPTTKNNLGVDCISKEQTIQRVLTYFDCIDKGCDDEWVKRYEAGEEDAISVIKSMPSVAPQEPTDRNFTKADIDAIVKAINAHWELIIDEIRAEIKGMTPTYHNPDWSITDLVPISEVLKLVDKHKAETEAEDENDSD